MQILSNDLIEQVSGGVGSRAEYDAHTLIWSIIGVFTAIASVPAIPAPYGAYFAIRYGSLAVGGIAGYVVGATEYYITTTIKDSLDHHLAPEY